VVVSRTRLDSVAAMHVTLYRDVAASQSNGVRRKANSALKMSAWIEINKEEFLP
jgi:hypothetical protein